MCEAVNTGPGEGYVKLRGIVWITLYLIACTVGMIVGLVLLWPSCETVNDAANKAGELRVGSIVPATGGIEGGTLTSIRGAGFKDGVAVSFGEVPVQDADVKLVDSTYIRVRSPAHVKGVVDVAVANHDHKSRVLGQGFLYVDPKDPPPKPAINSVSPATGPLAGGQPVTVKGSGLQNVTAVSFGGLPGSDLQVLGDTVLAVTTPPHGEGKVDVAVDAAASAMLAESYTYACWLIAPSRLFLMVIFAGALGGSVHGLRSLVWYVGNRELRQSWLLMYCLLPILGASIAVIFFFVASAGLYTIQGTGNFILIGLSALVGMFSPHAAEKLQKIAEGLLTNAPQGKNTVLPQAVAEAAALVVKSVNPKTGGVRGNTEVTISGKGFGDGAIVCFGGHEAPIKKRSPTSITAATPAQAAGTVDVSVINESGQSFTLRGAYEYVAEPGGPPRQ